LAGVERAVIRNLVEAIAREHGASSEEWSKVLEALRSAGYVLVPADAAPAEAVRASGESRYATGEQAPEKIFSPPAPTPARPPRRTRSETARMKIAHLRRLYREEQEAVDRLEAEIAALRRLPDVARYAEALEALRLSAKKRETAALDIGYILCDETRS